MISNKWISILGILPGLASISAYAQSSNGELSLEDILNLKTAVASKTAERVSDAPGVVTVYTGRDIENYGYYNIADLASITPGYLSMPGIGDRILATRGTLAPSYDNYRHLVLVDGIPVNFGRNGRAPTDNDLPLLFADRVDFLRGPGSALYGTGAFYGVINVVPKTAQKTGFSTENKVSVGGNNGENRIMSNSYYKDDESEIRVALGYYDRNQGQMTFGPYETSNPADRALQDDQNSTFLNLSYKVTSGAAAGLSAGLLYMHRIGGAGDGYNWVSSKINPFVYQGYDEFIPYLKYQRTLAPNLNLNSYMKYNRSTDSGQYINLGVTDPVSSVALVSKYVSKVEDLELLSEAIWNPTQTASLIVGVNADVKRQVGYDRGEQDIQYNPTLNPTDPIFTVHQNIDVAPSNPYWIASAYTQGKETLPLLKGLSITAGARFDFGKFSDSVSYSQISPRIALVQKILDEVNFKVMYGEAIRSPNLKELQLTEVGKAGAVNADPTVDVNPKPERIKTFEVATTYNWKNVSANITYFNNRTFNELYQNWNANGIYSNQNGVTRAQGYELDGQYALNADARLFANLSHSWTADPSGVTLVGVPISTINVGASYHLRAPFDLTTTLIGRSISGWRTYPDQVFSPADSNPKGFYVLDLNFLSQITSRLGAELQVKNLLNTTAYYPGADRDGSNLIPQTAWTPIYLRSFLGTLSYRF